MSVSNLKRWMAHFTATLAITIVSSTIFASPATSQEAGSIRGSVTAEAEASVNDARVELTSSMTVIRSITLDGSAQYRFDGIPSGEYTVRVTIPNFLPMERQVIVTPSSTVVADIHFGVLELDGILVTAMQERAELEEERALTPGGVTIVGGEDLFRRPINGLADMLRYVPGVWAESSAGGDELFFSSRGSNLDATDYDRAGVKLLQDGLPITSADGNNHNRVVDPLSVRHAVVARGSNGLAYGSSTLGGAIDFVSPTARNSAPASVFINRGSYGPFNGRATIGTAGEKFDGLLTVEGRQWDGYREQSSQERWGIYANTGWRVSDVVDVRVFGTYLDNSQRLPDALTREEVNVDPSQASSVALGGNYGKDVTTTRLATRLLWTPGSNRSLMAGVSYEGQSLYHPIVDKVMVDFDGPGPMEPVEVFSLIIDTDHRDIGAAVRYNHLIGTHDLVMGLNYGSGSVEGAHYFNDGGERNGMHTMVENSAESVEAYLVDRWRASNRLALIFGMQFVNAARDVRSTDVESGEVSNPNLSYTSFNPRVGVIASLTPTVEAYGNVSRLYEAPTTFEMEDDARGGNATLDPMSGTVAEAGLRSTTEQSLGTSLNWEVSMYYARINNEILSIDDPDAPGTSLTTNIDNTVHAGIEALVRASLAVANRHRIDPMVSLTVNHFRFVDDPFYANNTLPAAPTFAARGEVLYQRAGGLYFGPTFDLIGKRYSDFSNTYAVDGYGLMGVRAGLSVQRWELFGEIRNLFDTDYTATLRVHNVADAGARALYPGAPRSAYLGMRFTY